MKPMTIRLLNSELRESDIFRAVEPTDFVAQEVDHNGSGGVDISVRAHQCFFVDASEAA
jgi:hypothetical protein